MKHSKINPRVEHKNSSEKAYVLLERMIISGEVPARSVINEVEICEKLKLGRTPVRVAIQKLAEYKILEILPRRGILVTDIDVQNQLSILDIRRPLDRVLWGLVADRADSSQQNKFRVISRSILEANSRGDNSAGIEIEAKYRSLALSIAGNTYLESAIMPIYALSRRFYFVNSSQPDNEVDISIAALLERVAAGDRHSVGLASDRVLDELVRFTKGILEHKLGYRFAG